MKWKNIAFFCVDVLRLLHFTFSKTIIPNCTWQQKKSDNLNETNCVFFSFSFFLQYKFNIQRKYYCILMCMRCMNGRVNCLFIDMRRIIFFLLFDYILLVWLWYVRCSQLLSISQFFSRAYFIYWIFIWSNSIGNCLFDRVCFWLPSTVILVNC